MPQVNQGMAIQVTTRRANELTDRIASSIFVGLAISVPAILCFRSDTLIGDPDVWWHLKAAEWILQNGAWPTVDSFSSYGAGNAWAAYSWLPELVLYGVYEAGGLVGIVAFTALMAVLIAAAFHRMIYGLRPHVTLSVVLTALFGVAIVPVATPRPWLFSILLFILQLDLLLTAGRRNRPWLLLWLVPLFAVWANCHIQFIAGLAIMALATSEPLIHHLVPKLAPKVATDLGLGTASRMSFRWMLFVSMLCAAATLINPYHYRLYGVALELLSQKELWNWIGELEAMSFRAVPHWIVLASALGAAAVLGSRPRMRLLLPMVLLLGIHCAFRSQRDAWLLLVPALAILIHAFPGRLSLSGKIEPGMRAISLVVPMLIIVGGAVVVLSEETLSTTVAETYPVEATEFLKQQQISGPLYNRFSWGGFLIYHLPELPVSIDGRTMVHGEERVVRSFKTLVGKDDWQEDAELNSAGVVLLPKDCTLAALMRYDERFRLVHEDSVAVVYVPALDSAASDQLVTSP